MVPPREDGSELRRIGHSPRAGDVGEAVGRVCGEVNRSPIYGGPQLR